MNESKSEVISDDSHSDAHTIETPSRIEEVAVTISCLQREGKKKRNDVEATKARYHLFAATLTVGEVLLLVIQNPSMIGLGAEEFDVRHLSCCYLALERYVNSKVSLVTLPAQAPLSSVAIEYGEESNRTRGLSRISLRLVVPRTQHVCNDNATYRTRRKANNRSTIQKARREDARNFLGFTGHKKKVQAWLQPNTAVSQCPESSHKIREMADRFFIQNVHGDQAPAATENFLVPSYLGQENHHFVLQLPNAVVFTNDIATAERHQRMLSANAPEFIPSWNVTSAQTWRTISTDKMILNAINAARNAYLATVVANGAAQAAIKLTAVSFNHENKVSNDDSESQSPRCSEEEPTWDDIEYAISRAFAATSLI